ncbi:MAG: hypothetical protein JWP78_152 [Mucilaginibacter sp.]|nr:hypothetical protein [Mucilaginibacter sp.]
MKTSIAYAHADILAKFCVEGDIAEVTPYGSGHINGTYYVRNSYSNFPDYLLQHINNYVFKDIPGLIRNIELVTTHLRKKISLIAGANPALEVLTLIPTKDDLFYYLDDKGGFWRLYIYLKETNSYDIIETEHQAFEGGKAFGRFQSLLADLDSSLLSETIPEFHNIESRLKTFHQTVEENTGELVKDCIPEIMFLNERIEEMGTILNWGKAGKLPLRITHNDTKFNNVLLDKNDRAQCVIDLDTVMPGYVAYDFGDAMRTVTNTAAEDEKDLSKININMILFEAYTKGYLKETIVFLTDAEIKSLIYGVFLLPYMQAVRFLTDFIQGDKYYKIHFKGHNLQRAKAQIQLLRKLEDHRPVLEKIINNVASSLKVNI